MVSYWKLFLIFVKIGALLIGGGYVILPIMYSEFSEKRNLVSRDDITDYFAISQSLPGFIAVNISVFTGYNLRGVLGAVLTVCGIIFVPFWTIIILASLIGMHTNSSILQSAFWGIGIAVIALILLTTREIWKNSKKNLFFYTIFLLTFFSITFFKLSPIDAIILFSLVGILIKSKRRKTNDLS